MGILSTVANWLPGGSNLPTSIPMPIPPEHRASPRADAGDVGFNHTSMTRPGSWFGEEPNVTISENKTIAGMHAVDAMFSSGWLCGLVDGAIASVIGDGLRLSCKPDIELLGWSQEQGSHFSKRVEALFSMWSKNPTEYSNSGRSTFAQDQKVVMRSYFSVGEALSVFPMRKARGAMFSSKVQLLDTARLDCDNTADSEAEGLYYEGGVETGVVINDRDPLSLEGGWQSKRIPFRSRTGKPLASLIFDPISPQQRRGITPIAPVIKLIRQHDALLSASLTAAQLATLLSVVITSGAPSNEVMEALSHGDSDQPALNNYLSSKLAFYQKSPTSVSGQGETGYQPAVHLFPGENLDLKTVPASADNLHDFARLLKLEICRCLNVPYSLTGDYSGASYSSVRMENAVSRPIVLQRRNNIVGAWCSQVFDGFLEEIIIRGLVRLPGGIEQFLSMRSAFQAVWRGPSLPQADEQKSAKSAQTRLSIGTTSLADEISALGGDWQEVLEQRAREKKFAKKLGLPDPHTPDPEAGDMPKAESTPVLLHNPDGSHSTRPHKQENTQEQKIQNLVHDLNLEQKKLSKWSPKTKSPEHSYELHNMLARGNARTKQEIETRISHIESKIEELQQ